MHYLKAQSFHRKPDLRRSWQSLLIKRIPRKPWKYAAKHDILCFDAGHVEEWFRRARIPMDAVGTVLEDGENHDGPLTDLVEIPPIPSPVKRLIRWKSNEHLPSKHWPQVPTLARPLPRELRRRNNRVGNSIGRLLETIHSVVRSLLPVRLEHCMLIPMRTAITMHSMITLRISNTNDSNTQ